MLLAGIEPARDIIPTDFHTTIAFATLSVCGLDFTFTIAIALGAARQVSTPSGFPAWFGIATVFNQRVHRI
jgi:hypothetical protein